MNLFQNLI